MPWDFLKVGKTNLYGDCRPVFGPLLVPLNWYCSFTRVVLEYQFADTGVLLVWY